MGAACLCGIVYYYMTNNDVKNDWYMSSFLTVLQFQDITFMKNGNVIIIGKNLFGLQMFEPKRPGVV